VKKESSSTNKTVAKNVSTSAKSNETKKVDVVTKTAVKSEANKTVAAKATPVLSQAAKPKEVKVQSNQTVNASKKAPVPPITKPAPVAVNKTAQANHTLT
jgi:hypothetical protein